MKQRRAGPPEWKALGPSTSYPCRPGERKHVGAVVPGRAGGTVTGCATPAKPSRRRRGGGTRKREGQYWLNGPGGWPLRKSLVRARLYGAKHARRADDPLTVGLAVRAAREFPCPTGAPFPHRPGSFIGDPEHPAWENYAGAVAEASADGAPQDEVMRRLAAHPDFEQWRRAAASAVATYEASMKRRGATESRVREAARHLRDAIDRGIDTGSAEYIDSLERATRARKRGRKRSA